VCEKEGHRVPLPSLKGFTTLYCKKILFCAYIHLQDCINMYLFPDNGFGHDKNSIILSLDIHHATDYSSLLG